MIVFWTLLVAACAWVPTTRVERFASSAVEAVRVHRAWSSLTRRANPRGTYSATIGTAMFLPDQRIRVSVGDDGHGLIELDGLVTFEDTFRFWKNETIGGEDTRWVCVFNERLLSELRRWRCTIGDFSFDSRRNQAGVSIRLPFRKIRILLRHTP